MRSIDTHPIPVWENPILSFPDKYILIIIIFF